MKATEKTLSELIKTMRKAEGLTQSELAMEIYSDCQRVCKMERGRVSVSWAQFLEIARVLGYTVEIEVKGGAE